MHAAKSVAFIMLVSFATIAISNRVAFLRSTLKTD